MYYSEENQQPQNSSHSFGWATVVGSQLRQAASLDGEPGYADA